MINFFLTLLRKSNPVVPVVLLLMIAGGQACAQSWGSSSAVSDPFESQYFINRYLGNPAMAGLDSALYLNAVYRKQFQGLPGSPVTDAFTADYNPGKRVGLGLIAYNDQAGLINRTRFALTYAYHLPIGESGQQLHFGLSGVFVHSRLSSKDIIGDENDPVLTGYNARKSAFEADYGMGYTDSHITLQASLHNLISFFKEADNTTADMSTFYLAAGYQFFFDGTVNSIEPQISLRGVKQYNSIADFGANMIMFHHLLNIFGIYHTSDSYSVGIGVNYKDVAMIQGSYLSQTTGLRNYTDGSFEISLRITPYRWK